MNYCIVAFAIVLIISTIQWIVDGSKNFHGPRIDTEAMAAAGATTEGLQQVATTGTSGENGNVDTVGKKSA